MADYTGTDGDDYYDGTSDADTIEGGGGFDYLSGWDGDDTIRGGDGNDTLFGGAGRDLLIGGAGNDRFLGGTGGDRMLGGAGNDYFEPVSIGDRVDGGVGDDIVFFGFSSPIGGKAEGGSGNDEVRFNEAIFRPSTGIVELSGFEHIGSGATIRSEYGKGGYIDLSSLSALSLRDDTLLIVSANGPGFIEVIGGAERDIVIGGYGDDILNGGAGDDVLSGFVGTDTLIGGDGIDTVEIRVAEAIGAIVSLARGTCKVGAETDRLQEIENVTGTGGDDRIVGDGGANRLDGSSGNDRLFGGSGDDVLIGYLGVDELTGGRGSDVFDMNIRDHDGTVIGDTITDFSQAQGDRIDLSTIDANWQQSGDQHFTFIGTAAFGGHSAELRYQESEGNTLLLADFNGDTVADYGVRLVGRIALVEADLILGTGTLAPHGFVVPAADPSAYLA